MKAHHMELIGECRNKIFGKQIKKEKFGGEKVVMLFPGSKNILKMPNKVLFLPLGGLINMRVLTLVQRLL